MSRTLLLLTCVAALSLAGCGKDAGPQAFLFESQAHAAEGEPILFRLAPKAGDSYEMKLTMSGSIDMQGDELNQKIPMDTTLSMTFACEAVRENGDSVLSMTLGGFGGSALAAPGGKAALAQLEGLRMTMELDRFGSVKRTEIEGGDPALRTQMEAMLSQVGGRPFLIYPAEGLRIGEAIDYAKIFEASGMKQLFGAAGTQLAPEIKGEAVLVRRLQVDGVDAAEFTLNLVMNMKGKVAEGKNKATMDVGFKITGTQLVAIATGMPVGRMQMAMDGRGVIDSGDDTITLNFHMDAQADTTHRPAPAPAAPPTPEADDPGR